MTSTLSCQPDKLRALYQSLALVAQALANPNRLQLLEHIAQGERSVEPLAIITGLSIANTSQHLQALRQAGMVVARKKGQRVFYSIAGHEVVQLYTALQRAGEAQVAEVERLVRDFIGDRCKLEPIRAKELLARVQKGLVTVLDVRPADEFSAGHLPGAINIPIDQLERGLARLPKKREVVAYCRGPYCLMSFEAVMKLCQRGWQARRLERGFPEWKAAGLPVEVSSIARSLHA
ncbi:metalloregulator ArsR/SmtB family transcription factor [Sulfuricaulis sp.]|jgi:rhodanese-related sulfurtransferase|uniref:metalloregulator ArsR/SmtB family transcription factor n=1 Tax=Sulfuricaulis sp. TaxID=2003553 RepID=UPI00355A8C31